MRTRRNGASTTRHDPHRLLSTAAVALVALGVSGIISTPAWAAQAPVGLGTAESFAVLAGAGITNANQTTIIGDVGTSPTPSETGFDTVTQTGANHHGDAVTQQAKVDLVTAYNAAAGASSPTAVAVELGGTTVKPGVYKGATLEITGTLTLDTEGDPNAVFIFQTGSTLVTAANSAVVVRDGATACNVFWQVPSSATLGTDSHLVGTVLASTAISAGSGATIAGRLLAQTASVTLDNNRITVPRCSTPIAPDATDPTGASATSSTGSDGGTMTPDLAATAVPDMSTTSETVGSPGTPLASTPGTITGGTPGTNVAAPGGPRAPGAPVVPPFTSRPPLPNTGVDEQLPTLGLLAIAVGVSLIAVSKLHLRPAS